MIEFIKYCFEIDDRNFRGVVPGGARGVMAPPDFRPSDGPELQQFNSVGKIQFFKNEMLKYEILTLKDIVDTTACTWDPSDKEKVNFPE